MADETTPGATPATPVKNGPGRSAPNAGGTAPQGEKDIAFEPAEPLKSAGAGSDAPGGARRSATQTIKDEAGKLSQQAAERARGFAGEGKAKATGALDEFSRMMDDAAGTVDEKLGEQYGQYARSAASAMSGFADTLRGKEVDDLVDDVRDFVRKSPVVAIGTAAAIGFVLARVIKAGIDGVADAGDRDESTSA